MKVLQIITADDYPITAHYFKADQSKGKTIVISIGVGMPQRFFFKFAAWLSNQGFNVYTFDYRGIALSKPKKIQGMKASFYEWTNRDFKALTQHVRNAHPEDNLYHIGHSFGGNSLGMSSANAHYEKFLMVGSQYGYYKNFSLKTQLIIVFSFGFLSPIISRLMGYFPSPWVGLGEPLPKQIMLDWGTMLLKKKSMLFIAESYKENHYAKMTQPMLVISIEDDNFAPKKSVDALVAEAYQNAAAKRLHIRPKEYGIKHLGHNNFFRQKHMTTLWPIVLDWFNEEEKKNDENTTKTG